MTRWRVLVCAVTILFGIGAAPAQQKEYAAKMQRGAEMQAAGNYPDAIAAFREAVNVAESRQLRPRALATALNSLGMVYDDAGRISDAARVYRRTLAILEKEDAKKTGDYAAVLGNLAAGMSQMGQRAAAQNMLRESIAIYTALGQRDDARLAILQTALAETLLSVGRYREAEELLAQALTAFRARPEMRHHEAISLNNLGVVRGLQKRHREAVPIFEKAIQLSEAEYGPEHPKLLQVLNNLGLAYFETGNRADADRVMLRALSIAEARLTPNHPNYGTLLINYANVLKKTGRKAEAKVVAGRGKSALG